MSSAADCPRVSHVGLSADQRAQIVNMYRSGAKTAEISAETGAQRSTIYFVLSEEGVTPNRKAAPHVTGMTDHGSLLDWALTRVVELEKECARLTERLEQARRALR